MLWKITLVFCFALYYVNGKSVPSHATEEHGPVAENVLDGIKHFFQRFQDIEEIAQENLVGEKIQENVEYLNQPDDLNVNEGNGNFNFYDENVDNNEEKYESNLKLGYSHFQNRDNEEYENSINNENENVPKLALSGAVSKLTISQFPKNEIQALASKIPKKHFEEDKLSVEETEPDNNEFKPKEKNDIETEDEEIFKNDQETSDFLKTIQNDQQDFEDKDDEPVFKKLQNMFQAPNDQQDEGSIPSMFQGLQKLMNFQPDQLFGPKLKPNVPNFNAKSKQMEPKVGIGQQGYSSAKMKIASLTEYVKKAVLNAQTQLKRNGPHIHANNPPLVLNEIPGVRITLKLKHVEGVSSITPFGESKGIYYNKLYAFTQYKFKQLKYFYDVQIEPLGLFAIPTKMNIILDDTPAKMQVSIEKDKKMNLLHFEFVKPKVQVDFGHPIANYGINYIIQKFHPVIKNRIVEIVSRDSKLMLESFVKAAQ